MRQVEEKRRVRAAFAAAAAHYDALAKVQQSIAAELAQWLQPEDLKQGAVLDAGCGTGSASALLQTEPAAVLFGLDHAHDMCRRAAQRGQLALVGDIEALPLAEASLGLYWSSLAWQWCASSCAAREAARVLKPGGVLLLATLGPGSLDELRSAFAGHDKAEHVRHFESAGDLCTALQAQGLRIENFAQRQHRAYAPTLPALLQGVRGIGAHVLGAQRRRGLLGRKAWLSVQAAFEARREARGLSLSYEALLLRVRKPSTPT